MPVFAAVDIGSNSVRLSIARLTQASLQVIHQDREVTRLGEGVFQTGTLDPKAIAHTIKVLKRFHRAVQSQATDKIRVVATSAMRDARNSRAFIEWVKSATGWRVEIISGLEEGRLIHLGVMSKSRVSVPRVLLIDLGGGSCELTLSRSRHIEEMVSLPLGAVRLTQEFLEYDPPRKSEMERMRVFIAEEVQRISQRIARFKVQLTIATSGTAAALAGAAQKRSADSTTHSMTVSRASTLKLAKKLAQLSKAEREAMPGIGPRRAEIIIAGASVYAEVLKSCALRGFRYSPLGLRDGLLAQLAADYDVRTRPHQQTESDRQDALLAMCKKYGVDLKYAEQVRMLALKLFSVLSRVHNLPTEYKEWLGAAAMLQEVGSYVNRAGRNRHTYYIIANSEMFGFSIKQRQIIAAIARYQGRSKPFPTDRLMKNTIPSERDHIVRAVVLMRLARALNQSRRSVVASLTANLRDEKVGLRLSTKGEGIDLEMWALEKEVSYFREVFGRDLAVALS
jgi:exopolyphosphatase/guanosine-5'-triphosphate,3'-diphosphate pyrophosphatase